MKQAESLLQTACVNYFRIKYPNKVIFSIPNGGARDIITGARLKKEGVLPGVADLFILQASNNYHGLFIELKNGKNRQTEGQLKFELECHKFGYMYRVAYDLDQFAEICRGYLGF